MFLNDSFIVLYGVESTEDNTNPFFKIIMSKTLDLKKLVIEEFSEKNTQERYYELAENGFWISEKYFISKYFTKKGKILDLGCGTGRTSIPFVKMGYKVVAVDLVPEMIESAKRIAKPKRGRGARIVGKKNRNLLNNFD